MENRVREEVISKLADIGVSPYDSRILSQKWRKENSIDSESLDAKRRLDLGDGIWILLKKLPQKLHRRYHPSGQVAGEEIRDLVDNYFTDSEFIQWHESGKLRSLSLRVSKDERQTVMWNDDGEVSYRTIDRQAESFDRFVCLNCGDHTLTDGFGHAGFGDSGFMYSDSGRYVFHWEAYDPAYLKIVGDETFHPWMISQQQKIDFEQRIKPLPDGTRFRFSNFARCGNCGQAISPPLPSSSYLMIHNQTIWTTFRPSYTVPTGQKAFSLSEWIVSLLH